MDATRSGYDMVGTFGAVQSLLLSTKTVEDLLAELAKLAAAVVEAPASVGITVHREGQPITAASSDERASQVDETQYEYGEGPCLQALKTGAAVEVTDQRTDDRWPDYGKRAYEQGVRRSLSLPLSVGAAPVGAMNIYGYEQPGAFSDAERAAAEVFAAQASTALTLLIRQVKQTEESEQLEQALSSRTVIDQAVGVLMGQQRCSAEAAFTLLRQHSQNTNRKLREVAAELIERMTGQPPSQPRGFVRAADAGSTSDLPPQQQ